MKHVDKENKKEVQKKKKKKELGNKRYDFRFRRNRYMIGAYVTKDLKYLVNF